MFDQVKLKALAIELSAAMPPPPESLQERDVSPRARRMRQIQRIADQYRWQEAINHFLDSRGACYMTDLTDPQLSDLLDRMEGYVDAAMCGHDLPDSLPAS